MPRIRIIGLPKAQVGVQVTTTTTAAPMDISNKLNSSGFNSAFNTLGGNETAPYPRPIGQNEVVVPKLQVQNQGYIQKDDSPSMAIQKGEQPGEWVAKQNKPSLGKKVLNVGDTINTLLPFANLATDMVTNTIKQKEWDKKMRAETFNTNPINYNQDRGDWDSNTGIFRANQLSTPNIGMYAQDGGALSSMITKGSTAPIRSSAEMFPVSTLPLGYGSANLISLSEDFTDYANKAQTYISKVNPNTDITGEMLAVGAQTAYNKYGKIVPVELALAQLQEEGYLAKGNKLNKPQRTKNPFNVGNTDQGNVVDYSQRGLQPAVNTYFNLIARSYLKNKTPQELLNNFTNYRGERYASGKGYESALKTLVSQINNTLSNSSGNTKNTGNMKIRIVGTPDENKMAGGGQPKYSGQSDYGLYIGQRNLYSSMPENPYKNAGNSVTEKEETAEDPYVLEAEGGETILRPDGTHMNITGKRHSEGGERLTEDQAPEGSFIYSDTAKMKLGGKVLENFGKGGSGKKKYTPAELAKQYNVNKYRAILQDTYSDKLQKDTASRMIENYERKLAELALVQEGKKGFPQGIPDVAKKLLANLQNGTDNVEANAEQAFKQNPTMAFGGGLEKYQNKGERRTKEEWEKETAGPGWTRSGRTATYTGKEKIFTDPTKIIPGTKGSPAVIQPGTFGQKRKPVITPAYLAASPEKRKQMSQAAQAAWAKTHQGTPAKVITPAVAAVEEKIECAEGYNWDPVLKKCVAEKDVTKSLFYEEESPVPGTYTYNGNDKIPYGWSDVDKRNLAATMFGAPKKYLPWSPQIEVETYRPTFDDWRAKAATRQAATNNMMNTMGAYGPSQGLAANTAFMQGQQADQLIGDIAQTHSTNVGIANNAEAMNVQLRNAGREFKMKRAKELYDDGVIAKQQYDNAMRDYVQAGTQAWNQGDINAANTYNMNITESPYYYIDPRTGIRQFRNEAAKKAFFNDMKNAEKGDSEESSWNTYMKRRGTVGHDEAIDYLNWLKGQTAASRTAGGKKTTVGNDPNKTKVTTPISKYGGGFLYNNPLF